MRSVGVDVGAYSIKIAEVEDTTRGYRVNDYSEIPLSNDPTQDNRLLTVDALRKVARHYEGQNVKFIFSVGQDKISLRQKTFPFKERHQIVKSLPFQISDEVPFDQMDAIFEAKFLATHGSNTDILALVCPKRYIREVINLANDAGIEPSIVTAHGVCLANLFMTWNDATPETDRTLFFVEEKERAKASDDGEIEPPPPVRQAKAILDIGHKKSLLTVYHHGHLLLARTIPFGGKNIAQAIAQAYNISEVEGLKNLEERGFVLLSEENASKDQVFFSDTIKESLKKLISPLKRTLLNLSADYGLQFDDLALCGGTGRLMNLGAYLTQEIEIPCNPFRHLGLHEQLDVYMDPSKEYTSGVAIGLAVEGLRRPRNPSVDFRKHELAPQSHSFQEFVRVYSHTLKIAAAAVVFLFFYGIVKSSMATDLSDQGYAAMQDIASSPGLNLQRPTPAKVSRFVRSKKKELEARVDLAKLVKMNSSVDIINQISKKFPSKGQVRVDIKRLLVNNENVQIEGEVSQASQKRLIQASLQSVAANGLVSPITPSFQPAGGKLPFAYRFKIQRLDGE